MSWRASADRGSVASPSPTMRVAENDALPRATATVIAIAHEAASTAAPTLKRALGPQLLTARNRTRVRGAIHIADCCTDLPSQGKLTIELQSSGTLHRRAQVLVLRRRVTGEPG